ncbi:MAG TPA: TIGR02587 family membrane protein [Flavobacteriaceae bacterium]|nr:TIGR02587 family membrane protein [Flavobacteriaceae bacterium]
MTSFKNLRIFQSIKKLTGFFWIMENEKEKTSKNLKEFGRGIIGGLLFSLPIIYTMEVWWTGFLASPEKLIVYVLMTFALLLGYNKFAGMRKDASFLEICRDSVEETGLAFIITFLFLWLVDRITLEMSLQEIVGKVIVESMVMAIGISVGTAQLGQKSDENSGMVGDNDEEEPDSRNQDQYVQLSVLSVCGAALVASSVAPTEEIMVMGIQSSFWQLLLMVVLSVALSAVTLYFSDFRGTIHNSTEIEIMAVHISLCYLISLLVSIALLWFYGRLDNVSFQAGLAQTIVLSIPASVGASAGRLLIANQSRK